MANVAEAIRDFEATVMKLNKHAAKALQLLASGLGQQNEVGAQYDASDLAYFAAALGKGEDYIETLRKVFLGEDLAKG